MDEETRARVFEPFFTTKARGRGTGLGLAGVRDMMRRAGGAVDVQSEVGAGTVVTLLFPVAAPAAQLPAGAPSNCVVFVEDVERWPRR
jgi:signal transduction histidine kinase